MIDFARSFDRAAEDYERGRPGYAEAALDALGLPTDAHVLDLAAGTGKLTRQLVRRFERVVAVEPLDGMRKLLAQLVPEAEVRRGTAEDIPLEDAEVDAAFVGEAFHWFTGPLALVELARVLHPGGTLAILFNQSDGGFEPALPEAFWETFRARALEKDAAQRVGSGIWREAFPGPFEELREASFPNPFRVDRDGLLAHVASWSMVAALPDEERASLVSDLGELVPEGEYALELRTELYWTRLPSRA
jgi:ubiquinone/menaquinone biosynthesis C-methylase UbiE